MDKGEGDVLPGLCSGERSGCRVSGRIGARVAQRWPRLGQKHSNLLDDLMIDDDGDAKNQ